MNTATRAKYESQFDEDTIQASTRFVSRIKNKVLRKQYLPNTAEAFPIEKAAESFDHFLATAEFKALIENNGE